MWRRWRFSLILICKQQERGFLLKLHKEDTVRAGKTCGGEVHADTRVAEHHKRRAKPMRAENWFR